MLQGIPFSHTLWVIFSTLAVASASAQSPAYTIVDLGDLGYYQSQGLAINSAGQVTGVAPVFNSQDNSSYTHAFFYDGSKMQDLGTLALGNINLSQGNAMNDQGQVAGFSRGITAQGVIVQHAFSYSAGTGMVDLGALLTSGAQSTATGVNASGQVAGYQQAGPDYSSWFYDGSMHRIQALLAGQNTNQAVALNDKGQVLLHLWPAQGGSLCYLWANGLVMRLPVTPTCVPAAISNQGWVTGDVYPNQYAHGFVYAVSRNGQVTDLGTLAPDNPSAQSHGLGVNDAGVVVGSSMAPDGSNHAFIYSGGSMTDLNALIPQNSAWAVLQTAAGINSLGQITGSGMLHTGGGSGACEPGGDCELHAFRLDPQ